MQETCKNCKISRSFEDGPLGPESSLTNKQSQEYIENMNNNNNNITDAVQTSLKEQTLVENHKPYYNAEGLLILPLSWKDEDDPEEDEYWRKFNEKI